MTLGKHTPGGTRRLDGESFCQTERRGQSRFSAWVLVSTQAQCLTAKNKSPKNHRPAVSEIDFPENPASQTADACVALIQQELQRLVQEYGEGQDVEVVVALAGGGQIVVTWFGYHNPDIIKLSGIDASGNDVCLLAHKNTLQVVLRRATNSAQPKPPITFQQPGEMPLDQLSFNETA